MKKLMLTACAALIFAGPAAFSAGVDVKASKVTWKGSKVVGSTHEGTIGIKSADLKFKKGEPVSGKVVIDMTTIKNTDLKDAGYNKKLVGHLKSDDFFGVDKHKTATLDISSIKKASDKFYLIKGDLMIKGKKQPVTVKAEVTKNSGKSQMVKTTLKFDRTKFGIKYGSGSFFDNLGDKMISDEVEVTVELKVQKDKKMASN